MCIVVHGDNREVSPSGHVSHLSLAPKRPICQCEHMRGLRRTVLVSNQLRTLHLRALKDPLGLHGLWPRLQHRDTSRRSRATMRGTTGVPRLCACSPRHGLHFTCASSCAVFSLTNVVRHMRARRAPGQPQRLSAGDDDDQLLHQVADYTGDAE